MVGLVVPELQNPIFPALAEVVAGALAQRGFNAVLCTRTGACRRREYVEMLLERQVSGMIFAGGQYAEADAPHDHYTRLLQLRLPVVLVNAAADHLDFPRVSTDDAVAMEQAYAHLAYLGHERDRADPRPARPRPVATKAGGIRAASSAPRSPPDAELVERTRFSLEGGHAAGDAAASRAVRPGSSAPPIRWRSARSAPRGARALDVPGDLSVVGYDDSAFMSLHRPAADDGAPADRGDRARRGRDARRADRRARRSPPRSCSSSRRSSPAARPPPLGRGSAACASLTQAVRKLQI